MSAPTSASPRKSTNLRSSPLTVSSSSPSLISMAGANSAAGQSNNGSTGIGENGETAGVRRKLRSHTRQNPGAQSPLTLPGASGSGAAAMEQSDQTAAGDSVDAGLTAEHQHQPDMHTESTNDSTTDGNQATSSTPTSGIGRKRKQRQQLAQPNAAGDEASQSAITTPSTASAEPSQPSCKQQATGETSLASSASTTSGEVSSTTPAAGNEANVASQTTPLVDSTLATSNPTNCIKKFLDLKSEVRQSCTEFGVLKTSFKHI